MKKLNLIIVSIVGILLLLTLETGIHHRDTISEYINKTFFAQRPKRVNLSLQLNKTPISRGKSKTDSKDVGLLIGSQTNIPKPITERTEDIETHTTPSLQNPTHHKVPAAAKCEAYSDTTIDRHIKTKPAFASDSKEGPMSYTSKQLPITDDNQSLKQILENLLVKNNKTKRSPVNKINKRDVPIIDSPVTVINPAVQLFARFDKLQMNFLLNCNFSKQPFTSMTSNYCGTLRQLLHREADKIEKKIRSSNYIDKQAAKGMHEYIDDFIHKVDKLCESKTQDGNTLCRSQS